ncbi:MAG: cytochrome [Actinomycetia bacterium]|nr:cytochrome [Actinomycetes bacterium]
MPPVTDIYYDPYDATIDRDPHPTWKRLRDESPLYYNEQHDFYALSRYDDVLTASLDWQTYSSARGTVIEMIDPSPTGAHGPEGLGMMIFMDPPRHDDLRKLVSRAFTPRRVTALDDRLRELCAELLDPLAHVGGFDYLEDFAARIPAMIIGALMGVPNDEQDQLRHWIDTSMRYEPDGISAEKASAMSALSACMNGIVDERKAQPRDDMVSDLLAAEIALDDGTHRRLTHEEVMAFFSLLQFAGTETTARLLGWAAVLLARNPDQRTLLRNEPERVGNAVEELLRYEAPSPIQARFVTREVEWHGTTLPANSKVALLTGSAGRDERKFADADRFDVTRHFDRHMSFGYGIHFCLGANLARLEAKAVLEETLRRLPDWHVDEAEVEFVRTSTVRGPSRVPIQL